jgi:MarR family 2-MHQ and catechol resistance regulon transcriptional repressor
VESPHDRRVRTVSPTQKGREMFVPLFRRHTVLIKRVFQDLFPEGLQQLELMPEKIGKRAERLAEKKGHSQNA